ncbi:MAG: copper amine oxidase N-terminal domain-containing protein [Clostridia bacterium]|nr:copper amine oxidase N-terminal domain-containing protein [Clostridia bacterium]
MKLKRLFGGLIVFVMMLGMVSFSAFADGVIKVVLDGAQLTFDVQPQLINDRTMVPMRKIFESMGAEVYWDGATSTVSASDGNTSVVMQINNNVIKVNDSNYTLDVPPVIVDGRTLVPVRAVAESFDADVQWIGETKTVEITSKQTYNYSWYYMDSALQANVGVTNADWISYNENGRIHFRNRARFVAKDFITLTSYSTGNGLESEAQQKWEEEKNRYASENPYAQFKYSDRKSVGIGNGISGYMYPYEMTFQGRQIICSTTFWKNGNMFYICTSSAEAQDLAEVQNVLKGMLYSFNRM